MTEDADGVINLLVHLMGFDPMNIMVMGRSLGTGVSCILGTKYEFGLLVLISAFTSIKQVARHNYTIIVSTLVKEQFNNLERIKSIRCPVLFLHGKDDTMIPPEQSHELFGRKRSDSFRFVSNQGKHHGLPRNDTFRLECSPLHSCPDTRLCKAALASMLIQQASGFVYEAEGSVS